VHIGDAGRWIVTMVDGRAMPVTVEEYKERLAAKLVEEAPSLDAFRARWIVPRFDMWRREHAEADVEEVPAYMVTGADSGLDPHITLDNALYQLDRVADAWAKDTHLDAAQVRREIRSMLEQRAAARWRALRTAADQCARGQRGAAGALRGAADVTRDVAAHAHEDNRRRIARIKGRVDVIGRYQTLPHPCALPAQSRNGPYVAAQRIETRIGVHLGDVIGRLLDRHIRRQVGALAARQGAL